MIAQHPTMNLDDILAKRGIAQAAQDAGWMPAQRAGQWGWLIPLYRSNGDPLPVQRWKNADSNGDPKCLWAGDSKQAKYYMLPGTLKAIAAANGLCYLASGEPDALAYHAAGIKNVISWFGEGNIPNGLVNDLRLMGIKRLLDFPDRDTTGMNKAAKLTALLAGSGIDYVPCKLPGEVLAKHGNDINWLWMRVNFDRARFQLDLVDAPQYLESELADYQGLKIAQAVEKPLTTAQVETIEKVAYARFITDLKKHINGLPGVRSFNNDGWSTAFKCLFHDDHKPSASVNNQTGSYKCFVSGCVDSLSPEEFGERLGIRLSEYRDKLTEEFKTSQHPANVVAMPQTAHAAPTIVVGETYVSSNDAIADVEGMLLGTRVPDYEPIKFAYKTLHQFDGFAKWQTPAKLNYYLGISGGGKTGFMEYLNEVMLQKGHDTIVFSPEWTAQETYKHSVQRAGGMTYDEMSQFELWRIEEKRDVPAAEREGRAPSQDRLKHTLEIIQELKSWKGTAYHLKSDITTSNMNQLVDTIEKLVEDKRAEGRKVSTLFIDYLQRLPKGGGGNWDHLEMVAGVIKGICERQMLFGHIAIQPKKGDSKAARDGDVLDSNAGQGISDQQANLFLTFTPLFDPETKEKRPYVQMDVVKNSNGRTGKLYLRAAWQQRMICDVEHIFEQPRPEAADFDYTDDNRTPF